MEELDHREDIMMERNLMVRKRNFLVTNVTILDTLQGIAEHLKVTMGTIRGEMHMYVNYEITLSTQQDFVEWIKGTLIRILITRGITMIEGMIMEATTIRKK